MEALDLKKFIWVRNHVHYDILAITQFEAYDVVVYRERHEPYRVAISTVDEFCKDFQATYQVI